MKFGNALLPSAGWEILSQEVHFDDPHLAVATEVVRSPGAPHGRRWIVAHRKPAVIVAALTIDQKLVLIRQERIPIRTAIWEVPAGQIDEAGEHDEAAIRAVALRELREETGYELSADGEVIPLGNFFSSPGFTDEQGHFVLARGVTPGADGPAHTESESILECRAFGSDEVCRMIARNEIRDANTLGICARLFTCGFLSVSA